MTSAWGEPVLEVADLRAEFAGTSTIPVVRGVSFTVHCGEKLAIVGESGCGKSTLALALLGLLQAPGRVAGGSVHLNGRSISGLDDRAMGRIRGRELSFVCQDPMGALDPIRTIGDQISDTIRRHQPRVDRREAQRRAARLLSEVEVPAADRRLDDYPHHYSGGMLQRVLIAIALANNPSLVIADEPTTALDVTTQAQVLALFDRIVADRGVAIMLITHNLGVVAEFCDTVHVMYAGRMVESGGVEHVVSRPTHPYTEALLAAIPRPGAGDHRRLLAISGSRPDLDKLPPGCSFEPRCAFGNGRAVCLTQSPKPERIGDATPPTVAECHFARSRNGTFPESATPSATPLLGLVAGSAIAPLLEVKALHKTYPVGRNLLGRRSGSEVRALDGISFAVNPGETLGIIGESGCGKSTLVRCILRLIEASSGSVVFDGVDLLRLRPPAMREVRRRIQIVLQDATGSLDPRMSARQLVEEPLVVHGLHSATERQRLASEMLSTIGIPPSAAASPPGRLSGGQRQRIGIARALILQPRLLVLDEPVSALDVSVQAQILNLLRDLQERLHLTYLFIVHDLSVAEFFCDRIAVLYLGRIVELGSSEVLFRTPEHPYTVSLLSAIPSPERQRSRQRIVLRGEVSPLATGPVRGCPFQPRCPLGRDREICRTDTPMLAPTGSGHLTACHFPGTIAA